MPPIEDLVNVFDFDAACKQKIPKDAYDYISGGAEDEFTLRRNREAFGRVTFRPNMLVDVSRLDLSVTLFGQRIEMPILIAPTGAHRRAHADGELATARAAGAAKTIMAVSTSSSYPIDQIGKAATGPLWFQLYAGPDADATRDKVERAVGAGCKTVCLTVDAPYFPHRERDIRNRMVRAEIQNEMGANARRRGAPPPRYGLPVRYTAQLTWSILDDLNGYAKVPVLIKGILTPGDAHRAVERGAAGIIVSNHGGRYLDGDPATIEVLPGIIDAAAGKIPVLIDGGFRRGADVLKALAIGAKAVLLGRPPLWGLGAFGQQGVERVLQLLQTELALAMGLAGRPNLASIDRSLVVIDR
ncbi:MAG: alpha-hydroxy-acid oxidizing protein [Acidobacteria bacterium]|nr:alpha-hydroxy-acid oxidizing protein [Acidobacteriota bacterium]MBI3473569.1 alpha-hydroxy-acid oxidizing protein [Candidatus Solibacter usitatus]